MALFLLTRIASHALRPTAPYLSRAIAATAGSISTTKQGSALEPEAKPTLTEQQRSAQSTDHIADGAVPTQESKQASDQQNSKQKQKTMAEPDEELKLKMEGLAGDGGEAGVELEDGQPVAMKRSVKNNMFRYI